MITFDNLRVSNRKVSLDLTEAVEVVAGISMISDVGHYWYTPLFDVISGSWASVSTSEARVEYTGASEVHVADVDGAAVFEVDLLAGAGVWMVATDGRFGVVFENDELQFCKDAVLMEKIGCAPDFSIPFRVVYTIELDSNLLPVYCALSVYNADSILGTHVFSANVVASAIHITTPSSQTVGFSMREIYRPTTYLTIDVSEFPQESLARLTHGLPVTYFGRYNGSMFVKRTGVIRDAVFDVSQYYQLATAVSETVRMSEAVTRARVSGALPEGEQIDLDGADKFLLRFDVFQNPEILSRDDAVAEAGRLLRRNYERTNTVTLDWHTLPFLEHGDIILVDGERFVFENMSFEFAVAIPGSVVLMRELVRETSYA